MSEQELKLHVPPSARRAVLQEIRQGEASSIRLHALYFDTPSRELARSRIALRLRQEGSDWVQTLKMPGADAITRIEINHPRPGPILDLSVYAGTEFEGPLSSLREALALRYETDVQRILRNVRSRYGTLELAYDTGILRAGALELPIAELEFELVSGRPSAIFSVARRWQQRHSLVLDARSKSERGDALANLAHELNELDSSCDADSLPLRRSKAIAMFWQPTGAAPAKLDATMSPPEAMGRIAGECLDQVIRNAAIIAEVDTLGVYPAGNSEHVHQLRVGMRRLRSAWKLFDGWITPPPASVLNGARTLFGAFGENRDQDVLNETVTPMLVQAGMPAINFDAPPPDVDSQSIAAGKAFQGWLLDALSWSLHIEPPQPQAIPDIPAPSEKAPEPTLSLDGTSAATAAPATLIIPMATEVQPVSLTRLLIKRLQRWHNKVIEEGSHFSDLDIPARHELRKRGKRLRYGLAFSHSLLPQGKLRVYGKQLAKVQNLLGEINDLAMAKDYYQACTDTHPQSWFALGWISARLDKLIVDAQEAFNQLALIKPFQKK